jgi:ADP-L-glycero-D-manno-heptose 6-epimerase
MRSVVLRSWEQITESGKMQLFRSYKKEYADGEQLRDFLYVKDAVKMVEFIFNKPSAAGLFNIGSGIAESWNHLVTAAFNALKKPVNIEYIDMPESLRDRYQYYTCASIEKLRNLGYSEKVMSLDDAVADYICNYLERGLYLGDE